MFSFSSKLVNNFQPYKKTLSKAIAKTITWLKKFRIHQISLVLFLLFLVFLFLDLLFPLKIKIEYSPVVLAADSSVLHTYLTKEDKWRLKTELNEIIPELREAIVFKEDKYFYWHFGVNPFAIVRASMNNLLHFKTTSGASTITMQVARLLTPKKRNLWNKMSEAFRAFQLEWHYSKAEILQLYLNLIPYGSNIEGVKSAALLYFNKMPDKLSLAQITSLAIIPNRPTSLVLGKNNPLIQEERNKWLRRFQKNKVFSDKYIQGALTEVLNVKRLQAPDYAPHFCLRLLRDYPHKTSIYSTLNFANQEKVQQLTYNYVQRLQHLNIHNAAVLVVNNQTRTVEVYVGSADFEDKLNAGEVDGIQGIRSPGSTLKPLVYALSLDKGKITPKTVMEDVPNVYSGFEPENFYKKFSGKVTVEKALVQSLNTTAVKTLEDISTTAFVRKLGEANFKQVLLDEKKLGLSMILGGCGVRLEEMVGLYASLAMLGKYGHLKYVKEDTIQNIRQFISPSSAFVISEILAQAKRPDLPFGFENTFRIPKIAWKTGTSYGRRDAWSIGYNPHYTVGVWVGNFSGEGVNNLVGAEIATPLLFEIFNLIDYNSSGSWYKAPKNLQKRWVCSESGLVPNSFCKNRVSDYYIPLVSSSKKCTHLKELVVSEDEQISYCLSCQSLKGFKKKMYPNLSPEMIAFYEAKGIAFAKIPPHNPSCTRIFDLDAPIITSPTGDKEYIIDRNNPPELQLACKVHNEVEKVYWYINEVFYKSAKANEKLFFKPDLGEIKISCSDDKGRNANVTILVLYE